MQHDLLKELEPIAFLADAPYWIISKNAVPAKNLRELIAWLKANPGKATAGTIAGGGSHVCGAYLQTSTGTSFQFVPYRGGAPALQDLVAGQIDFMCDFAANSLEQFRGGNVRAYAVMAKHRWQPAPDVPTADRDGLQRSRVCSASLRHSAFLRAFTPVCDGLCTRVNALMASCCAAPGTRGMSARPLIRSPRRRGRGAAAAPSARAPWRS